MLIPPHRIPETRFLEALSDLLTTSDKRAQLCRLIADPRLSRATWQLVFHRELLELYRWAAGRICFAAESSRSPDSHSNNELSEEVLSLLPNTAVATHLLRRAVPFAALGIPTSCGFPKMRHAEGTRVINVLAPALGIDHLLYAEPRTCTEAVASAPRGGRLIIITGHAYSARQVKEAAPGKDQIVGSTGRCAVLLGVDRKRTLKLHYALVRNQVSSSCSRLRATFICNSLEETSNAEGIPSECLPTRCGPSKYEVADILMQLHPSVIFVPATSTRTGKAIPDYLCGYKVISCSPDGSAANGIGFGADPVFGWPGDYMI